MKNAKRNVVIVGFSDREKEKLDIKDIRKSKDNWKKNDLSHRFPYVIYADDLETIKRKEGFALIVKFDDIGKDLILKKLKTISKKYIYVIAMIFDKGIDKQVFNIHFKYINHDYEIYNVENNLKMYYKMYLESIGKKQSKKTLNNLDMLYDYIKDKDIIKSEDIESKFNVSYKWAERYMNKIIDKYHTFEKIHRKKEYTRVK